MGNPLILRIIPAATISAHDDPTDIPWPEDCCICGGSMMGSLTADGCIYEGEECYCSTCGAVDAWLVDDSDEDNPRAYLAHQPDGADTIRVVQEVWDTDEARDLWREWSVEHGRGIEVEDCDPDPSCPGTPEEQAGCGAPGCLDGYTPEGTCEVCGGMGADAPNGSINSDLESDDLNDGEPAESGCSIPFTHDCNDCDDYGCADNPATWAGR